MGLPAALTPGTVIGGHYIIGQLINSGGFGAVYRGVDTSEGNRPCAIKETYDVTPAARRQALMEASVLFTVRNQHLPEVYDALEDNGRFYLIMQMIEGENLLQILRSRIAGVPLGEQEPFQRGDGPCSLQEVLAWLLPIMDVLQDLHNRNILHRDIKPGNIILTPDQTTVLVDFGLTRLYDPSKETGKLARAVTEGYSPPEQYLSKTMPQSDIYSMAATIYLLLTNRLPPSALQRTVNDTLIPPRHLNPSLPPAIERALVKALAVQPEQRYQSIREFADALRDPAGNFYNDQTVAGTFVPAATQPSIPSAHVSSPSQPALVLPAPPTLPAQPAPMTPAPPSPRVSAPPAAPPAQMLQAARQHQQQPLVPPHVYQGVSYPPGGGGPASYPYPFVQPVPQISQPMPPGYVMVPQEALEKMKARPSASGQGCLWGLVQGVLSGVLVAFTTHSSYFYLGLLMGFFFYILAGFITTQRGGSFLRGGWAGMWAGVISTISFWLVYGLCYLILLVQAMQQISDRGLRIPPDKAVEFAARSIHTALPSVTASGSSSQSLSNFLILVGAGLLLAWFLGVMGGLLGSARFKARLARMQQKISQQAASP